MNPVCSLDDIAEVEAWADKCKGSNIAEFAEEHLALIKRERSAFLARQAEASRQREAWLKANPLCTEVIVVMNGVAQWVQVPA